MHCKSIEVVTCQLKDSSLGQRNFAAAAAVSLRKRRISSRAAMKESTAFMEVIVSLPRPPTVSDPRFYAHQYAAMMRIRRLRPTRLVIHAVDLSAAEERFRARCRRSWIDHDQSASGRQFGLAHLTCQFDGVSGGAVAVTDGHGSAFPASAAASLPRRAGRLP